MNLTGKITNTDGSTIPSANVYLSDKNGNIKIPTVGSSSDLNGAYTVWGVKPDDYVTVSYLGMETKTKQIKDIGSGEVVNYDVVLAPKVFDQPAFEIIEKYTPKNKNYTPHIVIGILAIFTGIAIYKSIK